MPERPRVVPKQDASDPDQSLRELRARATELALAVLELTGEPTPDSSDLLSVAEAALLAGRSKQCIRDWIDKYGIGTYSKRDHHYHVSRRALRGLFVQLHGVDRVPAALVE
jgi:hypothetical protein